MWAITDAVPAWRWALTSLVSVWYATSRTTSLRNRQEPPYSSSVTSRNPSAASVSMSDGSSSWPSSMAKCCNDLTAPDVPSTDALSSTARGPGGSRSSREAMSARSDPGSVVLSGSTHVSVASSVRNSGLPPLRSYSWSASDGAVGVAEHRLDEHVRFVARQRIERHADGDGVVGGGRPVDVDVVALRSDHQDGPVDERAGDAAEQVDHQLVGPLHVVEPHDRPARAANGGAGLRRPPRTTSREPGPVPSSRTSTGAPSGGARSPRTGRAPDRPRRSGSTRSPCRGSSGGARRRVPTGRGSSGGTARWRSAPTRCSRRRARRSRRTPPPNGWGRSAASR